MKSHMTNWCHFIHIHGNVYVRDFVQFRIYSLERVLCGQYVSERRIFNARIRRMGRVMLFTGVGTKISVARFPIPWAGQGYPSGQDKGTFPSGQDRGTTLARIGVSLQTGYATGGTPLGLHRRTVLLIKYH